MGRVGHVSKMSPALALVNGKSERNFRHPRKGYCLSKLVTRELTQTVGLTPVRRKVVSLHGTLGLTYAGGAQGLAVPDLPAALGHQLHEVLLV